MYLVSMYANFGVMVSSCDGFLDGVSIEITKGLIEQLTLPRHDVGCERVMWLRYASAGDGCAAARGGVEISRGRDPQVER